MYSHAGRLSEDFRTQLDSESDADEQTGFIGGVDEADNTMISGGDFDRG